MDMTGQTPPRRRRSRWRTAAIITAAVLSALLGLAVVIGIAAGGGKSKDTAAPVATFSPSPQAVHTDPAGGTCPPVQQDAGGYCPGDSPSPTAATPDKVTFVVTGTGAPSITYGSDSDNRDGGGHLGELGDGNALPWQKSLGFDGNALYYSVSAQLEGSGDITCKIIVSGPGDNPTTVATGHASGGYNICSAQAAPDDSSGTSWTQEG